MQNLTSQKNIRNMTLKFMIMNLLVCQNKNKKKTFFKLIITSQQCVTIQKYL